jgi:hypothetical protein
MATFSTLASFLGFLSTSSPATSQAPFLTRVDPACERTLPTRVVQFVSGRSGVTLIPRDARAGAHGTCNYAISGDTVILSVAINPLTNPAFYESYRRNCGHETPAIRIGGVGDEALACAAYGGGADHAVVVHKGQLVVVIQSTKRLDPRTRRIRESYFTTDQLTDLARTVVKQL